MEKISIIREFRQVVVDLNHNENCGSFGQTRKVNSRDSLCCLQMEQILEEKTVVPLFLKLITMIVKGFAAVINVLWIT